jgi:hypothetical protein
MVVGYLDILGAISAAFETDSPWGVDSNAVLPGMTPAQSLKPIALQGTKVGQAICHIQNLEALFSLLSKSMESANKCTSGESHCFPVPIAPDTL